jgi:hypothetical protein
MLHDVGQEKLFEHSSDLVRLISLQWGNTKFFEAQVRCRIVPLDADRPGLFAIAVARVVVRRAVIGPVQLVARR